MTTRPEGGRIPTTQARGGPYTRNARGEWVPMIPMPLYLFRPVARAQCHCGRRFRSSEAYRGHYALVHIWEGK